MIDPVDAAERDREISAAQLANEITDDLRDVQSRVLRLELKFRHEAQLHDNFENRPPSVQYGWGMSQTQREILTGAISLSIDLEHVSAALDKEKTPE